MKVVILAGGLGTRLGHETSLRPKPMVEVGGRPVLWHLMKFYSHYGFNDFVVLLGYKGYVIKEYFLNYRAHESDLTIDLAANKITFTDAPAEPWRVTLVDTGLESLTGRRLALAKKHVGAETFMMTYGDGVGDVDLPALLAHHRRAGKAATVTCPRPAGRFGLMEIDDAGEVTSFMEKPADGGGWINGGFFVLEPKVFDYIEGNVMFEREPMNALVRDGELAAYRHHGYWQCMDTPRDREELDRAWELGRAPWKVWAD